MAGMKSSRQPSCNVSSRSLSMAALGFVDGSDGILQQALQNPAMTTSLT